MNSKNNLIEESFDDKCRFIIKLGKAAHKYGSPTLRLEAYLNRLAMAFGLDGEFHSTPTNMIFAFRKEEGDWQKINLSAVSGGLDLTKLPKLDNVVDEVISGKQTIKEAENSLSMVEHTADPYGNLMLALGYVFLGAGIAGLLSGSWMDIIFSSIFSVVVYLIVWYCGCKGGWLAEWIPLSTAFIAGILAVITKQFVPELNYMLVTLSAIIVLVPGYSVSIGVAEIVNNHVVSGLTNLTNGLVYLFKQFIGAWLAFGISIAVLAVPVATATPVDIIWSWAFVPALFIGLIIVFQTSTVYFLWAFFCCALGYGFVILGGDLMGSNLGNLLGAMAVGVFANIWEWKTGKPGSIVLLPAITVLVSGSIGFRGLMATAQGHSEGTRQFLDMFLIAITLTAGLLIANSLVKPKKSL